MNTIVYALLGGLGALAGACGADLLRPYLLRTARADHGGSAAKPMPGLTSLRAPIPAAGLTPMRTPAPVAVLVPLTALVVGTLAAVRGPGWDTVALVVWTITGCALAAVDIATLRLPDDLTLPLYPMSAGLLVVAASVRHDATPLLRAVAGMLVLLAGYATLIAVRPGQLGHGDLKLAGSLGLVLGWLGWRTLLLGTLAAFSLAAFVGVASFASPRPGTSEARRADRLGLRRRLRTPLPFGPFLLAGAWWAMLFAPC